MAAAIVASGRVGFEAGGPALPVRDHLPDRRDQKAATATDVLLLAALRSALDDTWSGDMMREDAAVYVASTKQVALSVLDELLAAVASGPTDSASFAGQLGPVNPFVSLASLPNLGVYYAVRYFGLAGPSSQFTCGPWADVVATQAGFDILDVHEAAHAVVGASHVSPRTERSIVNHESVARATFSPGEDEGAVALLLAAEPPVGPTTRSMVRRPILLVGGSSDDRHDTFRCWLDEVRPTRLVWLGDGHPDAHERYGATEHRPLPRHELAVLAALSAELDEGGPITVVADYGDALGAIAVDA